MILERIQISEDKKKLLREQSLEQKRIKAIQKKEFILHNLKSKYSNIESLRDTNSLNYKNLTKLEQKWIDTLNLIDSNKTSNNVSNNSNERTNLIYSTNELISTIGSFDPLYG